MGVDYTAKLFFGVILGESLPELEDPTEWSKHGCGITKVGWDSDHRWVLFAKESFKTMDIEDMAEAIDIPDTIAWGHWLSMLEAALKELGIKTKQPFRWHLGMEMW